MKNKFQTIIQRVADRGKERIQNTRPQTFVLCCTAVLLLILLLIGVMVYESYWLYHENRYLSAEDVGITQLLAEEEMAGYAYSDVYPFRVDVTGSYAVQMMLQTLETANFQRCSKLKYDMDDSRRCGIEVKSESHSYYVDVHEHTILIRIDGKSRYYLLCGETSGVQQAIVFWQEVHAGK